LIVLGDTRQRIQARVQRLPAEDLSVLDQLTAHLSRPTEPPDDAS